MTGSMFMDLRTLYGRHDLVQTLKQHAYRTLSNDQGFLMRMAQNMTNFVPPLGWFGKIKLERSGPQRGKLDIKKAGIFAITDGIKALAVQRKVLGGSTLQRLEALRAAGIIDEPNAAAIDEAFRFMVLMRLRSQVEDIREGREPDNYIRLERLNVMETGRLKIALGSIEKFQDFLRHHFGLHLVRN